MIFLYHFISFLYHFYYFYNNVQPNNVCLPRLNHTHPNIDVNNADTPQLTTAVSR